MYLYLEVIPFYPVMHVLDAMAPLTPTGLP